MMKIYNFSAGPACLPETVLQAVRDAAIDYSGSGMSVMEMSHRSKPIVDLFKAASFDKPTLVIILITLLMLVAVQDFLYISWIKD